MAHTDGFMEIYYEGALVYQGKEEEYHGHPLFQELTTEELTLHNEKNKDYAQGGDPLGNFKRVSAIKKLYPGLPWDSPVGVALGYMLKQLDAALWMLAQGYEGKVENIDSRLTDIHVYAKLARILHKESDVRSYIISTDNATPEYRKATPVVYPKL